MFQKYYNNIPTILKFKHFKVEVGPIVNIKILIQIKSMFLQDFVVFNTYTQKQNTLTWRASTSSIESMQPFWSNLNTYTWEEIYNVVFSYI